MILSREATNLLDSFLHACNIVTEHAEQRPPKDEIDRSVMYRYYFYLSKSAATFRAFDLLVRSGLAVEAQLLSRANFELLVDLVYFHRSPIDLSARFEDFFRVACAIKIALLAVHTGTQAPIDTEECELESLKLGFCTKYGCKKFPKHWTGCDRLIDRARIVGMAHSYETTYRLQSDIAHSGIFCEASYIRFADPHLSNEQDVLEKHELARQVGLACADMLSCLTTIEEGLQLLMYDEIHDLHDQHARYADMTNRTGRVK